MPLSVFDQLASSFKTGLHTFFLEKTPDPLITILTIKHGQMDLPNRILELEPALLQEADLLHQRLEAAEKKRNRSHPKK